MLFPSKVTCYNNSILSKLPIILRYLERKPKSVLEIYKYMKDKVSDISELIEALDCLYALGSINFDNNLLRKEDK